jgi:4-hydroxybenzoate polyprenyltransferase
MGFTKSLQNLIDRLENIQLSFSQWFATLMSIILMRNFLETFSDFDNYWRVLNFQRFIVHYPISFISLLCIIVIILHLMSKERIERITTITILFSLIIWSVPVLDLILSRGKGFNISYLNGDFGFLMGKFITFFGSYSGKGASYGMRIEIGIVLFLTFLYVYLKTGKIIRSIATPFIIYICIFTLLSLPSLTIIFFKELNSPEAASRFLESEMILNHFYSFDLKISLIFSILISLELILWMYLYDKNKFVALLKNVRVFRVFHYEAMLAAGMALDYFVSIKSGTLTSPLSYLVLLTALLSVFFAWLCAVGINDLSDIKIDLISNRERPLASGILTLAEYKNLSLIFFLQALLFGYLVRYSFMALILVYIVLLYVYSARPLRLRRIPILSSFIIASASLIIMMSGFLIFSQNQTLLQFPRKVILLILLVFTLAVNFKDIKDIEGDKKDRIITLLTLLGERKGKIIVGA